MLGFCWFSVYDFGIRSLRFLLIGLQGWSGFCVFSLGRFDSYQPTSGGTTKNGGYRPLLVVIRLGCEMALIAIQNAYGEVVRPGFDYLHIHKSRKERKPNANIRLQV